ncbi:MAG: four helix bundle protein [Anaerolineae bacterium]
MATIKKFEEIEGWQKARELTGFVYEITRQGRFSRDFGLKDQIRRAAVSAMSNIAEGFERDGRAEFVQFLSIAKASTGEVQSQLYVALDQGYISQAEFERGYTLCQETANLIGGFMNYLRSTPIQGKKHKPVNPQPTTHNS